MSDWKRPETLLDYVYIPHNELLFGEVPFAGILRAAGTKKKMEDAKAEGIEEGAIEGKAEGFKRGLTRGETIGLKEGAFHVAQKPVLLYNKNDQTATAFKNLEEAYENENFNKLYKKADLIPENQKGQIRKHMNKDIAVLESDDFILVNSNAVRRTSGDKVSKIFLRNGNTYPQKVAKNSSIFNFDFRLARVDAN